MNNLKNNFLKYLEDSVGVSKSTLKFYKSDFSHFTGWLLLKVRSIGILSESVDEAVCVLNPQIAADYKHYLEKNTAALKTLNRRLSTLRHFSKFLLVENILPLDFMRGITNVSLQKDKSLRPTIDSFKKHLETQKVSKNTIKSYLSDINQFFDWMEGHERAA